MSNVPAPHAPSIVANLDLRYITPTTLHLAVLKWNYHKLNQPLTPEQLGLIHSHSENVKKVYAVMINMKLVSVVGLTCEDLVQFRTLQEQHNEARSLSLQIASARQNTLGADGIPYASVDHRHNAP